MIGIDKRPVYMSTYKKDLIKIESDLYSLKNRVKKMKMLFWFSTIIISSLLVYLLAI
jgi:hypothetical protein